MALSKEEKKYLIKLGNLIVKLREKRGLKQYELSDLLDIDVRVLRRIEKGETNIHLVVFLKFVKALDVDPSYFFDLPTESKE
jgi:transcriptional regulator with XRE-family HTH domain